MHTNTLGPLSDDLQNFVTAKKNWVYIVTVNQ
jgi:hypothetical protein